MDTGANVTYLYSEKAVGELTTVCIPANKMKTIRGMVEFNSYIGSTNVDKVIEIYSKMDLPSLDLLLLCQMKG